MGEHHFPEEAMPAVTYEDFDASEFEGLWTPEDETQLNEWKDKKIADFEAGGKMLDKHKTREVLDEWLEKQCLSSKKDSLWQRSNPRVFFDMSLDGEPAGRIVMKL